MSERNNRKVTYLTDEEAAQLSEWADETDKSESHLLREAVLEYLDRDRSARVADRLENVEEKLDDVRAQIADDNTRTHTADPPMKSGSSAVEKARKIVRRLQSNHDEVMKDDIVNRAIEDVAGVDDRTIRKYKRLFRKRGILFEHPGEPPLWTTEGNTWLDWMNSYASLNGPEQAETVVEQYPATMTENFDGATSIKLTEENTTL